MHISLGLLSLGIAEADIGWGWLLLAALSCSLHIIALFAATIAVTCVDEPVWDQCPACDLLQHQACTLDSFELHLISTDHHHHRHHPKYITAVSVTYICTCGKLYRRILKVRITINTTVETFVVQHLLTTVGTQPMSEELCWLCNGKVWILKLLFMLFYVYNHDVTLTLYINWTVLYINDKK